MSIGWVYVLVDGLNRTCKVGSTKNSDLYRCNVQIASSSSKVMFVCAFECKNFRNVESMIHKRFSELRFNGEWFKIGIEELVNHIADNYDYIRFRFKDKPTVVRYMMGTSYSEFSYLTDNINLKADLDVIEVQFK